MNNELDNDEIRTLQTAARNGTFGAKITDDDKASRLVDLGFVRKVCRFGYEITPAGSVEAASYPTVKRFFPKRRKA